MQQQEELLRLWLDSLNNGSTANAALIYQQLCQQGCNIKLKTEAKAPQSGSGCNPVGSQQASLQQVHSQQQQSYFTQQQQQQLHPQVQAQPQQQFPQQQQSAQVQTQQLTSPVTAASLNNQKQFNQVQQYWQQPNMQQNQANPIQTQGNIYQQSQGAGATAQIQPPNPSIPQSFQSNSPKLLFQKQPVGQNMCQKQDNHGFMNQTQQVTPQQMQAGQQNVCQKQDSLRRTQAPPIAPPSTEILLPNKSFAAGENRNHPPAINPVMSPNSSPQHSNNYKDQSILILLKQNFPGYSEQQYNQAASMSYDFNTCSQWLQSQQKFQY